jgi:hypothetical protein
MMIMAGIVILIVIINALTDMALEVGGEQVFVKTTVKARRKGTPTKYNKDREQHRHKRAALMLTAMLVATTVATSNAELMNMEPTKDSNQPAQAVHGCRDPRSHTTKVEWRQNGHMVMAHATVVNVNQPTNAIGDGPYDPRANVPQRPLEEIVKGKFDNMTILNNALKYLFANVQHIETPTSIKSWQQVLDAADADVAIFVGTKLTHDKQGEEEYVPWIQHVQFCDGRQIDVDGESHK